MSVSMVTALPDIVSVQKKAYPLIFTAIVSEQPTNQPLATAFGLNRKVDTDDGSGWTNYRFDLDRWYTEVTAHKLKTEVSTELLQDLRALGLDEDVIVENLSDQLADDINAEIIDALTKISSVGPTITIQPNQNKFSSGHQLYAEVHDYAAAMEKTTGCAANYVVAGGKAFSLLLGSTHVKQVPDTNYYVCSSGLIVIHDKTATTDYVILGVKKQLGDVELSSLVFSTYSFNGDSSLAYQVIGQDPKTLSPIYGVISRTAITAAPIDPPANGVVQLDWSNLDPTIANSSKLSTMHTVTVA